MRATLVVPGVLFYLDAKLLFSGHVHSVAGKAFLGAVFLCGLGVGVAVSVIRQVFAVSLYRLATASATTARAGSPQAVAPAPADDGLVRCPELPVVTVVNRRRDSTGWEGRRFDSTDGRERLFDLDPDLDVRQVVLVEHDVPPGLDRVVAPDDFPDLVE